MDFQNSLKQLNIELNSLQMNQFEDYFHLLVSWNEKMNLTAITDREEVYVKHFLDSLSLVLAFSYLKESEGKDFYAGNFSLLDLGTGAGFPGIPLKILFPEMKLTLMDSLNKRITFLEEVIRELSLKESGEVAAYHTRAEEAGHDSSFRESFDFVVSRAVANLSTLSEYCLPFVKVGGYFIPYKSEKVKEELASSKNAIFLLGGSFKKEISFVLPDSDLKRSLLIIEKRQNCSKQYPRKAGLPGKKPL